MKIERLRQIEEIYHAASELPASSRDAFVREACGADIALRDEVVSLLELDGVGSGILDRSPEQLVSALIDDEPPPPEMIGTVVGHYRIDGLIGKGGMGEVYLARDLKLERRVALKFVPASFVANAERMNRFVREARIVSALNHPNIITIYEINEIDDAHFIATEFIDGRTLSEYVRGNPPDTGAALDIAVQIVSALEEANAAGIAHRDIKPDNIMIRENGLVKILDFGIAKVAGEPVIARAGDGGRGDSDSVETLAGTIIGTASYMSPEQARGDEVDTRTDIFSFGIVLYEMLEGRLPFDGDSNAEVIESILSREPSPARNIAPDVLPIVLRCLRKDRGERFQTARELSAALERVKRAQTFEGIATPTGVMARTETTAQTRAPGERLGRAAKFVIPALLLGLLGFFGWRYASDAGRIESLAVMPIVNVTGNADTEYLSDGITETLIGNMSTIPGLSIKARTTVFTYKGRQMSAGAIGRELGVSAVLFGRLTQRGDRLSLNFELVDVASEMLLWSRAYERDISDLAALQTDIAGDVTATLRYTQSESGRRRVTRGYPTSSEAQQLYLKGRFYWNKRTARDLQRAISYFEQAIDKDSQFALAYSGLADALALMPLYAAARPKEFMPRAKQAAERALAIDDTLAEAHASLGFVLNCFEYDWNGAEREYRLAIEYNPGYATAHQWYAENLVFRGRYEAAGAEIAKALELDPLSLVINRMSGNILAFSGKYDQALAQFDRSLEMYPDNAMLHFNIGDVYASQGKPRESVASYLEALRRDQYDADGLARLNDAFTRRGADGFWREYLAQLLTERAALLKNDANAYVDEEALAYAYACNRDADGAIAALGRAFDERSLELITIRESSAYDFLRDDPRFGAILAKVGLPPAR